MAPSFDPEIFALQRALEALGDIKELHLTALIERDDFLPFVTDELREELASFREERALLKCSDDLSI
jgi:hypothetical protein